MKQITVRGVPQELADRLRALARERGTSMNNTILDLLKDALGLNARKQRLARYATWTEEDFDEFALTLKEQRQVDTDLWK